MHETNGFGLKKMYIGGFRVKLAIVILPTGVSVYTITQFECHCSTRWRYVGGPVCPGMSSFVYMSARHHSQIPRLSSF